MVTWNCMSWSALLISSNRFSTQRGIIPWESLSQMEEPKTIKGLIMRWSWSKFKKCKKPSIVHDFPAEVWPYAITVPLKPAITDCTTPLTSLNTWGCVESPPKTWKLVKKIFSKSGCSKNQRYTRSNLNILLSVKSDTYSTSLLSSLSLNESILALFKTLGLPGALRDSLLLTLAAFGGRNLQITLIESALSPPVLDLDFFALPCIKPLI